MTPRERLAAVMKEKDMSARAVSLKAGLSDSLVHKYLTGQTKSITVDNLEKVAKALGVSLRYLMFGKAEDENLHYIWDYIPSTRRKQALDILETFTDRDTGSDAG